MKLIGQLHASPALPPGIELLIPLCRKLGRRVGRSLRNGEEIDLLPLPGIEPRFLGLPGRSPVTIPNDVPLLSLRIFTIRGENVRNIY
jgi:hypothetical protein